MGGDHAPEAVVEGAVQAFREGMRVVLVGDEPLLRALLAKHGARDVEVQHASQVVEMHEAAVASVRKKKDSSIRVAVDLVKAGQAEAVVSAGHSGAAMAAALFGLGRLPGVDRPALLTLFPTLKGPAAILDVGANVDVTAAHLVQFALMGEAYAKKVLGVERPRIALLSNGEEDSKGTDLTRAALALLRKDPALNFAGYAEGNHVLSGEIHVLVTDGFTGNVLLKTAEGVAMATIQMLKRDVMASLTGRLGALLLRGPLRKFRQRVDYAEVGGAPLLGVDGVCMIGHGRSDARAVKNMIRSAAECTQHDLKGALIAAAARATALCQDGERAAK